MSLHSRSLTLELLSSCFPGHLSSRLAKRTAIPQVVNRYCKTRSTHISKFYVLEKQPTPRTRRGLWRHLYPSIVTMSSGRTNIDFY